MSEVKLSPRLAACADLVVGKFACDVGTDHALLPSFLILSGKCENAVASDIVDGPLESARKTVASFNLENYIQVVKSDGLDNIDSKGVTDIVIAGMGGELIAEIVCRCEWIKKSEINLILQPMTKEHCLRSALCAGGFSIKSEVRVADGGFIYTIIRAFYTGLKCIIPRLSSYLGQLDGSLLNDKKYAIRAAKIHNKIASSLPVGHIKKSSEEVLAERFESVSAGLNYMTVNEIYEALDLNVPFSLTQKGDNSGLLIGSGEVKVNSALIALDITRDVILEAKNKNAQLIISHHPIIYGGLHSVDFESPVGLLLKYGISAICTHSPLDLSDGGMNALIFNLLKKPLLLDDEVEEFDTSTSDGSSYGKICTLTEPIDSEKLADILKNIFGCTVLRYTKSNKPVSKIAFCSGGGKSATTLAIQRGCDAYITGDVSHDRFIEAINNNFSIYDCGHFHTENIACGYLRNILSQACPQVEFVVADSSRDPAEYIF